MNAIQIDEAMKRGLDIVRCGGRSFLPVRMPAALERASHDHLYDLLLRQLHDTSRRFGTQPEPRSEDDRDGRYVQVLQDDGGRVGLPDSRYIALFDYSDENGIESVDFYLALEINA